MIKQKAMRKRDVPPTDQTKLFDQSCFSFFFFSCCLAGLAAFCLILLAYSVSGCLSFCCEITRMHSPSTKDTSSNPPTKASLARSFFSRGGSGLHRRVHVHVHALNTGLLLQVVVGVTRCGWSSCSSSFLQDPDLPFPPRLAFMEREKLRERERGSKEG